MYSNEKENKDSPLIPPTPNDLENQLAETIRISRQSLKLASNPFDAARQIVNLFEKELPEEKLKLVTTKSKTGTDKKLYVWLYAERIKYLLIKFLGAGHKLQSLIVAAREDDIYWRGDEFDVFVSLITQYEKMRSMPKGKYRKQSFRQMLNFVEAKTTESSAA